jgi:hypothetical protein
MFVSQKSIRLDQAGGKIKPSRSSESRDATKAGRKLNQGTAGAVFRRNFLKGKNIWRRNKVFFEMDKLSLSLMQSNVREPGENPGRLRHCNGYKFQCHRKREGGIRSEAEVRIPV